MRVLIATATRGPIGGVETYLRTLTPELVRRGHEIALLYEHRHEAPGMTTDDPYAGVQAEWESARLGVAASRQAVRAWRPELIWMHGLTDGELEGGLLELAPASLFVHNYEGLCATGEKFQQWPRPHPCSRRLDHGCWAMNFSRNCGLPRPSAFARSWRRQRQRARRLVDYRRVLVASRAMAAAVERQGVAPGRIRVVGYPLAEERLSGGPSPASAALPCRILMLARLTRNKGTLHLLRAAPAAQQQLGRELVITIAGNGPEQSAAHALAARLQLRTSFPGWVSPGERRSLLDAHDVLAMPSLWPEPFGMAGIEAAARGVPAVAYGHGGIVDWLQPGHTGELAPAHPPTVKELAAALVRALGSREHWEDLRRNAWGRSERFGLVAHAGRIETILRETVEDGA